MTLRIRDTEGNEHDAGFRGAHIKSVFLPKAEVTLEEFCVFAEYVLDGGFNGWGTAGEPACVARTLSKLVPSKPKSRKKKDRKR